MSGGRFEYMDSALRDEIFGYANTNKNPFEDFEISELVRDVFDLIHEYDWYASGDTDEDDYLEAKRKFKTKWFKNYEGCVKDIINKKIDELRDELCNTYELLR